VLVCAGAIGIANPPPHPVIAVTAPNDASSSTAMVIQRLRRLPGMKNRPSAASAGAASGHPTFNAAVCNVPVWIVSVEFAGELPGVTLAGWNVPVAPVGNPLTANVTALLNAPFCGVTVIVYIADPPAGIVCGPVGELMVNVGAGDPVPFSVTVCGAPVALSATLSVAVRLAADAGVNVTLIVQVCCDARESAHVLVSAKSLGFVPVLIPVIDSAVLPVLVSVAVCAALVVPTTPVNVSVPGVSVAEST